MITCPSCKQQNERHFKFCLGCGGELPSDPAMPTPTTRGWLDEDPGSPPSKPTASVTAVSTTATTCPSCGNVVAAGFTFCGQCGFRMDAPPPTRKNATSGIS